MDFLAINDLTKMKINYSQFEFKKMSEEERELLIPYLKMKIIKKNEFYERMIKNEEENTDKYILLHIQYLLDNEYRIYGDLKIINSNKEDFYIQSIIKNSLINTDKIQINNNKYIKNKLTDNYHWSDWE